MDAKTTILLTGGTGFIGSHAAVVFAQAGYEVVIVDNLSNSSIDVLDGIAKILGYKPMFYQGDIRDAVFLDTVFARHHFDGVVHFAALKAVGESCEKALEYLDNNVGGTLQLCKSMQQYNVHKILFSGSCTVYGDQTPPIVETMPIGDTTNPYGRSKVLCEYILQDMAQFAGMQAISLRYFNPIGAHPSGCIGEKVQGRPNNIFPYIMKVLHKKLDHLEIFGNDYPTPDGTGLRDYIDIMDLVQGHLDAYIYLSKQDKPLRDTFNLGTGKGVSVLELVHAVERVSGASIPYQITARRSGDIAAVRADAAKAKKILSWTAHTAIDDSVRHALVFAANNI